MNLAGKLETRSAGVVFLAEMVHHLPRQVIPDGPYRGQRPLAGVSLEPGENWLLALLESWALAGDVASFYLDRIAAEGYLATAIEELSVHELIRTLGYPPRPGVAGSAWVAYTVAAAQGMPSEVELPRRAKIQSLPLKGQLPQIFELPAPLSARVEWNALAPAVPVVRVEAPLWTSATSMELAGARTQLKKGLPLLVGGAPPEGAPGAGGFSLVLRLIDEVKVELGRQGSSTTKVSWHGALASTTPPVLLEHPAAFLLRRRARLFGYNATPWDQLPLATQRAQQSILGGVLVASTAGNDWQSANEGLPAQPIAALLATRGVLWAATERGLFANEGDDWQATTSRPARTGITSLAAASSGNLYAGTTEGQVLVSTDHGADWQALPANSGSLFRRAAISLVPGLERLLPKLVRLPKAPVKAVVAVVRGSSSARAPQVLAGGDSGVFANRGRGGPWRAINAGLPGTDPKTGLASLPVRALVVADHVYAGTQKGVFSARRPGARWQQVNEGLPGFNFETGLAGVDVLSLAAYGDRRRRQTLLLAGTDQGVFRRVFVGGKPHGPWQSGNNGLPSQDPRSKTATLEVKALVVSSDPATLNTSTFAGTSQGIYQSADLGLTWFAVDTGQPPTSTSALAVGAGRVVAATAFDGFAEPQWPGYSLANGSIDLAGVEEEVVPGSWIALLEAATESGAGSSGPPQAQVLPVLGTRLVRREDFGLSALVTRLSVPSTVDLSAYSLRDTVVLLDSQELALAGRELVVPKPLDASVLRLDRRLETMLPAERPVVVSGRPIRVRLPASARAADPSKANTVVAEQVVTALSLPRPVEAPSAQGSPAQSSSSQGGTWVELNAITEVGTALDVVAPEAELVWMSSASDAPTRAELARVAGCENISDEDGVSTQVSLVAPLSGAYDPQTVKIYANAAEALQGESVVQVLGSGNAAKSHQSFELTNLPLTYEPAANSAGLRSTLEVRVGGVLWREVSSFHHSGPSDQVYLVRRDLAGRTRVIFGDGVAGSRLPTGQQNVEATYRSGVWTGALEPDQLSLPRTRPLGVKGVTNPLPAAGATPPDSMEDLKHRAPRATRPLARIVSLTDFEDFALTFPGIARARLAELPSPAGAVLQITLAGLEGKPLAADGSVLPELERAISRARLPGPRVVLSSYRPLFFDVAASLRVDPAFVATAVVGQVSATLGSTYGFANSRFGQVLASSQVLATIREVPGVLDVELRAFFASENPPSLEETLTAGRAHWRSGRIEPAELLLIRAKGGISLEVVAR